jgi:hypothetical protein
MGKIDTEVRLAEELERYDQIVRSVTEDLDEDGLDLPDRPEGDVPQWPSSDVNKIRDDELFKLHFEFREFGRHVAGKAAMSRLARDAMKEKLALVEASVRKRAKGSNKEERDDFVTLDSLVQTTRQQLFYWEGLYRIHTELADMLRKDTDVVSRQMTQREKDREQGGRSRRAEGKGRRRRYES